MAIPAYLSDRENRKNALRSAVERDAKIARSAEQATTLHVWAAGFRQSAERFCGCAGVTPTRIYETSDPAEIRAFGAMLRHRRTPIGPLPGVCSPVTIEFVREGTIVQSINYRGSLLTEESASQVHAWLEQRQVWSKVEIARADWLKPKK